MKFEDATGNWDELGRYYAMSEEYKFLLSNLGPNTDRPMAGYFDNTMTLRDADGGILKLIRYRPDHRLSVWEEGEWVEGRWLINAGQDNSSVCHTLEIDGGQASWVHPFAPFKTVGDRWISPESDGGLPAYPLTSGGVPVVRDGEGWIVEGAGFAPGRVMALEAGLVPEPYLSSTGETAVRATIAAVSSRPDSAMAGYFGNTFMFREDTGKLIEVIYYRPDHTIRSWRDGHWVDGEWLLNDAQDNGTIFQTRDMFGVPASWCHAFSPDKHVGDHWIAPETRGGHPTYPIRVGGVAVVERDGQWVVAGTRSRPGLVMSMLEGEVAPF